MITKTIKRKTIEAVKAVTFPVIMAAVFYAKGVSVIGNVDGVVSTVVASDVSAALMGLTFAFAVEGAFTIAAKLHGIFK